MSGAILVLAVSLGGAAAPATRAVNDRPASRPPAMLTRGVAHVNECWWQFPAPPVADGDCMPASGTLRTARMLLVAVLAHRVVPFA